MSSLSGQWITRYSGNNNGTLVIDLDDVGDHYEGTACAWDDNPNLPNASVRIVTSTKANVQRLERVPLKSIDNIGNVLSSDTIEHLRANGTECPVTADIDIDLRGDTLSVTWTTPIQTSGNAVATKTRGGQPSDLTPLPVKTWAGFKKHINSLDRNRYIFRGQEDSAWRLRTSFYRTGRADLERYLIHDIGDLQKALSPITQYPFDLNNPAQYGAFMNLAQHHGYPTPMLDWTWSPYIAAFFAFRNIRMNPKTDKNKKIRIFKLDIVEWNKIVHYDKVFPIWPHVSILNALAFGNSRAIPQQSISTISNVDDIESHIKLVETANYGKTYLDVFELPASERRLVMQELALMGITAGSLFPGLDGACESLKERNF